MCASTSRGQVNQNTASNVNEANGVYECNQEGQVSSALNASRIVLRIHTLKSVGRVDEVEMGYVGI